MLARWQKWRRLKKRYMKGSREGSRPAARLCAGQRVAGECVHGGGFHHGLSNGCTDHDGGFAPRRPVAGADRESISGQINPALWPGLNQACSNGTLQSP